MGAEALTGRLNAPCGTGSETLGGGCRASLRSAVQMFLVQPVKWRVRASSNAPCGASSEPTVGRRFSEVSRFSSGRSEVMGSVKHLTEFFCILILY